MFAGPKKDLLGYSKDPSSAFTVWRPLSSAHSTTVPGGTVTWAGSKLKFLTVTVTLFSAALNGRPSAPFSGTRTYQT